LNASESPPIAATARPSRAARQRRLEREAPLGYALVLPALLYLVLFIAYPFLMSIAMSFSDAQAGNLKWNYVGPVNYSKVESYELRANDFVLASGLNESSARALVSQRDDAKIATEPVAGGHRAVLQAGGRRVPLLRAGTEDDAAFLGGSIATELEWAARRERGGTFRVVAHASDTPLILGSFSNRADLERARAGALEVPATTEVRTQGKGVLQDPNFRRAVKNTFEYTFGTEAVKLLLGVPCALLLHRRFAGRRILRGLIVIPWVIPIALSAQAWLWILDSTYSVINWTLVHWGIISPANIINFRGDKNWAMLSVIGVNVWRGFPFTTIVILAGLTAIPDEILERARLDGANALQRFVHVISPMVRPILLVSLLFSIIFSFTDFNTIWIITKGGPYDQTQVLSTYAYQIGVNAGYLGKGAAISLFMFPLMALMVFFMLRFLRKEA
jgi:multiple sugar transport system permease protein